MHGNYNLPKNSMLKISRDDVYKLNAVLTGEVQNDRDLEYKIDGRTPIEGELIKGDKICGYDCYGNIEYTIERFLLKNINSRYTGMPPNIMINFQSSVMLASIDEKFSEDTRPVSSILDFYLSGKINMLFPRSTDRAMEERYSKSRHSIDPEVKKPKHISANTHGASRDYFYIETSDFNFIVQMVDNGFLPDWANGIQIEYRTDFKKIPSELEREAISEIVSFVLGTHLLKIGESHIDASNNVLYRKSMNPWGDNVISKCSSSASPPISLNDHEDRDKIERVLKKLVPKYLELRENLGFKDVLWKYWIANELAIGTNLPILSSALESLAERYIESNDLTRSYSKAEKTAYKKLIKPEQDSLSEKLESFDFSKRVLDILVNPYSLGVGQKLKLFFQKIGLDFSNDSVEAEALKARNKMTHSSLDTSDEEMIKYLRLSGAYKSLFNRTLLKILEFDETYINFYSKSPSNIDMSENMKRE
ncbi:MAG: hypothetical protein N4A41_13490 [Crocinitomicaceae bacterium]|jgi:hypothetical protein|nr:hypothetical protein [Crocinitomicaceae bacterium]